MGENNQGNSLGRTDYIDATQTLDSTHYLMEALHLLVLLWEQIDLSICFI